GFGRWYSLRVDERAGNLARAIRERDDCVLGALPQIQRRVEQVVAVDDERLEPPRPDRRAQALDVPEQSIDPGNDPFDLDPSPALELQLRDRQARSTAIRPSEPAMPARRFGTVPVSPS